MNKSSYIVYAVAAVILQIVFADMLAVWSVRPDFILILVLYLSVWEGRFFGVIAGFILGIVVDLFGVASFFGLTALTYCIFSYLVGNLHNRFSKWSPLFFHGGWVLAIFIHFVIRALVIHQNLLEQNISIFWGQVGFSVVYTLPFVAIINYFLPLGRPD
ncbi:MAG: rod shape-determining protein MreD [Candidatus Neomarinimicrobiota bacterium]